MTTQRVREPRYDPMLQRLFAVEAKVPPSVHGLRLADYDPRSQSQTEAHEVATDFVTNIRDHLVTKARPVEDYPQDRSRMGKGLLFVGPPGTGKTHLAALVTQEVGLWVPNPVRIGVLFLAYADVISDMVERIGIHGMTEADDIRRWELGQTLDRLDDIPLLALDDMGQERRTGSGFAESRTNQILRARHLNALPTVLTSNLLRPQDWAVYGDSMESFIQRGFTAVPMRD